MKRTTYIIIGVFIAGWMLLVAGFFMLAATGRSYDHQGGIEMTENMDSLDVSGIKVLELVSHNEKKYIYAHGLLYIEQAKGEKANRFLYPKDASEYFDVKRKGDTLVVDFHLKLSHFPDTSKQYRLSAEKMNFSLKMAHPVQCIMSDARRMDIMLHKVDGDSLAIQALKQYIRVDSCKLGALNIAGAVDVDVYQSEIQDIYLDLDPIDRWSIRDCRIGTEHLRGKGNPRCSLEGGECKQVIWTPKTEDAKLNMTFHQPVIIKVRE